MEGAEGDRTRSGRAARGQRASPGKPWKKWQELDSSKKTYVEKAAAVRTKKRISCNLRFYDFRLYH